LLINTIEHHLRECCIQYYTIEDCLRSSLTRGQESSLNVIIACLLCTA